jgi:hypothetical protein
MPDPGPARCGAADGTSDATAGRNRSTVPSSGVAIVNGALKLVLVAGTTTLLVACPDAPEPTNDEEPPEPPNDEVAVCLRGEPFVADGDVPVDAATPGDADRIAALRWESHDGCERFVIDLVAEDGSPAGSAGSAGMSITFLTPVMPSTLPGSAR